jgi:hypothetical protein
MSPCPITAARLDALIAAYGADPERWPEAEREAGRVALATARTDDLHGAVQLDAQLDALALPPVSPDLRRRVLLAVAREPRRAGVFSRLWLRELWEELGGARIAAPALAMALGAGLGLGWLTPPSAADEADPEDLIALVQFDDSYAELAP